MSLQCAPTLDTKFRLLLDLYPLHSYEFCFCAGACRYGSRCLNGELWVGASCPFHVPSDSTSSYLILPVFVGRVSEILFEVLRWYFHYQSRRGALPSRRSACCVAPALATAKSNQFSIYCTRVLDFGWTVEACMRARTRSGIAATPLVLVRHRHRRKYPEVLAQAWPAAQAVIFNLL